MRNRWWFPIGFLCTVPRGSASRGIGPRTPSPPWEGGITASLGQPPRTPLVCRSGSFGLDWQGTATGADPVAYGLFGASSQPDQPRGRPRGGGHRRIPRTPRRAQLDGGIRALLVNTPLRLTIGADYNVLDNRVYPLLGFMTAGAPRRRLRRRQRAPGRVEPGRLAAPSGPPRSCPLFWTGRQAGPARAATRVSVRSRGTGMILPPGVRPPARRIPRTDRASWPPGSRSSSCPTSTSPAPIRSKLMAPAYAELRLLGLIRRRKERAPCVEPTVRATHADRTRALPTAALATAGTGRAMPDGGRHSPPTPATTCSSLACSIPTTSPLGSARRAETFSPGTEDADARGSFALYPGLGVRTDLMLVAAIGCAGRLRTTDGDYGPAHAPLPMLRGRQRLCGCRRSSGCCPEAPAPRWKSTGILEQAVGQPFTDGNRALDDSISSSRPKSRAPSSRRGTIMAPWIHDPPGPE